MKMHINDLDQRSVEIALSALQRVDVTGAKAWRIAHETVADQLDKRASSLIEFVRYADGQAYHRETEQINALRRRANQLRERALCAD
ncbi:MAG: hypothetical protein KZQ99_04500 [Candidatus Thiodiazotropha sp. (ex Dulcina madagascariensis)]|nr:hypothetical protein [Candidatus Thiodiazotropha sp. (ex Dulcina madagascariensis)]